MRNVVFRFYYPDYYFCFHFVTFLSLKQKLFFPLDKVVLSRFLSFSTSFCQIDGSTLKTLCMQHGPLVNFYLSLNHGFALVNYGSREEAAKVQNSNLKLRSKNHTCIYGQSLKKKSKKERERRKKYKHKSEIP